MDLNNLTLLCLGSNNSSYFYDNLKQILPQKNKNYDFSSFITIQDNTNKNNINIDNPQNIICIIHLFNNDKINKNEIIDEINKQMNIYNQTFVNSIVIFITSNELNFNEKMLDKNYVIYSWENITYEIVHKILNNHIDSKYILYDYCSDEVINVSSENIGKLIYDNFVKIISKYSINYSNTTIKCRSIILDSFIKCVNKNRYFPLLAYFMFDNKMDNFINEKIFEVDNDYFNVFVMLDFINKLVNAYYCNTGYNYFNRLKYANMFIKCNNINHIYYKSFENEILNINTLARYDINFCLRNVDYADYYNNTIVLKYFVELCVLCINKRPFII